MPRLFLDERNLRESGVHEQNIRTFRELTEFFNLVTQVQETEAALEDQATAIDAVEEAVEDQELSLTSLDGRVDDLEDFEALGPYLKLAGGTLVGALNGTSANFSGAVVGGSLQAASADIQGLARCDSFRIDQAPALEALTPTHSMTISVDGTNYKIALQAA